MTAADAVIEPLQGQYDMVVARHVVQVLSEEQSRVLIKNLAAVTKDGGSLFLIGMVLDNSRLTPQMVVGFNLVLLNGYQDGQAYTESEYFSWLAAAGFGDMERMVDNQGSSIIRAQK